MSFKKNIAIFTAIAGATALAIHVTNRIISFTSTLDNNLNTNFGTRYNWRFGEIFYSKTGSGSPVLLIHDTENYSSSYEWHKIIGQLSQTNTVYAIDLLGCGRSDKPNITYTNFLFVQLVSDFIKDIIGEKVDIVASSSSSSIAIMTAAFNNDSINRIIISNPSDILTTSEIPTKRSKFSKILINTPVIGTFLYNMLNTKSAIKSDFYTTHYFNHDLISNSEIKTFYESAHRGGINSKYLFASIKGKYLNTNIIHALKSINNSIYILTSDSSPNYLTLAEQYQKHMPSIETFNLSEVAKYPHLEKPDEFVKQINLLFE